MPCAAVLGLLLVCLWTGQAACAEVKAGVYGRIYADYFQNQFFTGRDPTGALAEDPFQIYQRLDIRFDFTASENLKFRYILRVIDSPWGATPFVADNPGVALQTYNAYLQFIWPDTEAQFTVGWQDTDLPWSSMFGSSLVLGNTQTASAVFMARLYDDTLELRAAYARVLDANQKYGATLSPAADSFDFLHLSLLYQRGGIRLTPWVVGGLLGYGCFTSPVDYIRNNLVSAGWFAAPTGLAPDPGFWGWAGLTGEIALARPVNLYFDAVYGTGGAGGRAKDRRSGWFFDLGLEYTGWAFMTPQASAWYSPGEDASLSNGSERFPYMVLGWGPGNSFLFDTTQAFSNGYINVDPTGGFGLCLSLVDVSFLTGLRHTLSYTMQTGLNSPRALRQAAALTGGPGNYVTMGNQLATGESVNALNFDSYYSITENLTLALETGYAHFSGYKASTWGPQFTGRVQDAFKLALGFTYNY